MSPPSTPILILDGGLGTTLESPPYSLQFGPRTPLWSSHPLLISPSTLVSIHRSFLEAGADVILSATYQTSFEGFAETPRTDGRRGAAAVAKDDRIGYGEDEAKAYMFSAIGLAREAFESTRPPREPRIALSLGPYGASMTPAQEYTGAYPIEMDSEVSLREWHARRLEVFRSSEEVWGECEWVAFETVKRQDEVRAVRAVMEDVEGRGPGESERERKKWWVTGVFPDPDIHESCVRGWVRAALGGDGARPWGIGVNCTGVAKVGRILEIMESEVGRLLGERGRRDASNQNPSRPWLVLAPDGAVGLKYDSATMTWIESEGTKGAGGWDEQVWEVVKAVRGRGNWDGILVGGCCKTGPEDIRRLSQRVRANAA
ncbi:MAG: AdoMet-homocysteine methyltransferase [Stictis urceolatum]|nr:AdoMet-homocysteine methyltransferase [Stictis urceolata]